MCTSFTLFSPPRPQRITAMNFDYFVQYKLGLVEGNQFSLQVYYPPHKVYNRPLGVNSCGTFMNTQLVNPNDEAMYRPGSPTVTSIHALLENVLRGKISAPNIGSYLDTHDVTYRRGGGGVHNMIATRDGDFFIVDPGRGILGKDDFQDGFGVLTNFPLKKFLPISAEKLDQIRCERFKTAYSMLLADREVDVDRAFEILDAVKQTTGRLPTIFSMVSLPWEGTVYFSVLRHFEKRFRFSFHDGLIRADKGLRETRTHDLRRGRISPEELLTWQ